MSAASDIITAVVAAFLPVGGGIAFVWNKLERRFTEIEARLEECHVRETESQQRRAVQLTVIELLWQELQRHTPDNPVLRRAKKLLDGLRKSNEGDEHVR